MDAAGGCVAPEGAEESVPVAGVASVDGVAPVEGVASGAGVFDGGSGSAWGLPGVIVSTAAEFPMLEGAAMAAFGCNPNPIVSSPVSLAGVMVGSPLRAALETSGLVFNTVMERFKNPERSVVCSFCIRATAVGSAGGTGTPNFTSLFFASPARGESG